METTSKMDWETKYSKSLDETYTVSYKSKKEGLKILMAEGFVDKNSNGYLYNKDNTCAWYENDRWFLES